MKIGIYGGSFNPIHRGHISVAKYALEKLNLDKLIIIPVGIPSHRENNLVNGKFRMEMCRLAFENMEKIEISDIEINNCGINYTY
ncbi:MAG: nicotinate-nicotinamide nucleotide adenylyltransferase, partial [Cetobacterium sp.]|nr:nicotinate-nicotinamide nucleotide adenylyltransferase [Cetobacterium sp.]